MRTVVRPPRTLHCDLCQGELRLKELASDGPALEFDVETFVCAKCSYEKSFRVGHDPYVAHTVSKMPPVRVG